MMFSIGQEEKGPKSDFGPFSSCPIENIIAAAPARESLPFTSFLQRMSTEPDNF